MIRALLFGVLLFVVFGVAFAPAGLLRTALPDDSGVELLDVTGTLWRGGAELHVAGQPGGRLRWELRPADLLRGHLGYDATLQGPAHDLDGHLWMSLGRRGATMNGQAAADYVNRWLRAYDIAISGELNLHEVSFDMAHQLAEGGTAGGSITWAGGPVRYRLADEIYEGKLPGLIAYLDSGPSAEVFPQGGQTPLLRADLLPSGAVRIGVTRLLTRLLGNPWPGSQADHEVVLEVEEYLF